MADYRRIVSYLYQYKNGRRGENVGFVRVQKAQDRLKIVLNVNDKKQVEDLMLRIYFYIHKNGKLYGIFVDNIVLKEGSCEYKRAFFEREIFKNGEKIDDMHGMLLYYSREMSYGTEWDDKKIEVEQFILEQKKENRGENIKQEVADKDNRELYDKIKSNRSINQKEEETGELTEKRGISVEVPQNSKNSGTINFLPVGSIEPRKEEQKVTQKIREQMSEEVKTRVDKKEDKREKSERISKIAPKTDSKIKNSDNNKKRMEENESVNTKRGTSLKETGREKHKEQDTSSRNLVQKTRENSIKNRELIEISEKSNTEKGSQTKKEEKKIETKTSISMIHMQERSEKDEIEIMLRDYPKIQDIDSEDLNDCVKIMPRDIGKMDTVNWWLRSNRLLLYRFEQYHYLLLGKRKNQDGSWQRVVGIPGIFDSKERYLASLFQFYCFIPTESKKYKTGSFGYWVTPIK